MTVRAITIDFWGTLLFDPPSSDNRYKMRRMKDFETILAGAGARASAASLGRAYEESASHLGRVWATHRDVPVQDHVRAILSGVDRALAARLPADVMTALVDAYARPILMVPPAVDDGALKALRKLCDLGYTLFAHTAFSDETRVRKPDPAIFLGALRALGAEPAHAIHVGDDAILDVEGARAAGMRVVQVTSAAVKASGARRPCDRLGAPVPSGGAARSTVVWPKRMRAAGACGQSMTGRGRTPSAISNERST